MWYGQQSFAMRSGPFGVHYSQHRIICLQGIHSHCVLCPLIPLGTQFETVFHHQHIRSILNVVQSSCFILMASRLGRGDHC